MKPEELTKQVFLSHTQNEGDLAAQIAEVLTEKGIKVWDDQQVSPGADWTKEIAEALKKSDAMIALLSPNSFSSSWVRSELEYALTDERYKRRLLPVLIGEPRAEEFERLPWILTKMQFLRLTTNEPTKRRAVRIAEAFIDLLKSARDAK
jgi:hypothetical protein